MPRYGRGFAALSRSKPMGTPMAPHRPMERHADTSPMLETFQLGFRNLQEVWSLVLPPVTLLELKRLARPSTERFHMPDELWVRIVYDFALAYRLRTLSRSHLLGALTPLYLGWVASYALEVANAAQRRQSRGWRSWLAPMKKASRIYYRGGVGQTASTLRPAEEIIMWTQVSQSLHESMARVISRIATLLPGILAFILAVLFFAAIAWVLAWLVAFVSERDSHRRAAGAGNQCDRGVVADLHPHHADHPGRVLVRGADRVFGWPGSLWRILRQSFSRLACWATFPTSWARWYCCFWATSLPGFFPAAC